MSEEDVQALTQTKTLGNVAAASIRIQAGDERVPWAPETVVGSISETLGSSTVMAERVSQSQYGDGG